MDKLDNISQIIHSVEPSPFLWTKIQGKIQNQKYRNESTIPIWKLLGLVIIILAINTLGMVSYQKWNSAAEASLQSNEIGSILEKTYSSIRYE